MVKFGDQFRAQQRREWASKYLRYSAIKDEIYNERRSVELLESLSFQSSHLKQAATLCPEATRMLHMLDTDLHRASRFLESTLTVLRDQFDVIEKHMPAGSQARMDASRSIHTPLLGPSPAASSPVLISTAGAAAGASASASASTSAANMSWLSVTSPALSRVGSHDSMPAPRLRISNSSPMRHRPSAPSSPTSPVIPHAREAKAHRPNSSVDADRTGATAQAATGPRLRVVTAAAGDASVRASSPRGAKKKSHSLQSMKRTLTDLYRDATQLRNFQILNYTAALKLIKKFKYGVPSYAPSLADSAMAGLHALPLVTLTDTLDALLENMQTAFALVFCEGDFHIAHMELLARRRPSIDWTVVQLGARLGIAFTLLIWALWDVLVDSSHHKTRQLYHDAVLGVVPVFRAIGAFVLLMWLWGLDLVAWRSARVNYLFILESDVDNQQRPREIFHHASVLTIWFCVMFLLYFKSLRGDAFEWLAPHLVPTILVGSMIIPAFYPWRKRKGLWLSVIQVLGAPFTEVRFRHTFIADIMTSMPKVLSDMAYTLCYFVSGQFKDATIESCSARWGFVHVVNPLLHSLPLWLRFMQNIRRYKDTAHRFPHLANAAKYAFAQSVGIFAVVTPSLKSGTKDSHETVRALWVTLFVLSTLYTYSWDVTMDWGLARRQHGWLRSHVMYSSKCYYFSAIVADFFLRFLWTFQLVPDSFLPSWAHSATPNYAYWISPFIAYAELCRRFMWAAIRLENEHVSNTFQHRRTDFVPLHFDVDHYSGKPAQQARSRKRVMLEAAAFVLVVLGITVAAVLT